MTLEPWRADDQVSLEPEVRISQRLIDDALRNEARICIAGFVSCLVERHPEAWHVGRALLGVGLRLQREKPVLRLPHPGPVEVEALSLFNVVQISN